MATVSGRVQYDGGRTAASSPSNPGLQGVSVVLQDLSAQGTGQGLTAITITNGNGNYEFSNVPAGSYQLVESAISTMASGTVDWSTATMMPLLNGGTLPPIELAYPHAPSSATNLDCTIRNTFLLTIGASNITQDFLNGPVAYVPLKFSGIVVDPINLITAADFGTFGSFSAGTIANTGAAAYPEIGSQFVHTMPDTAVVTPPDGSYTIQNIMNNAHSNSNPAGAPSWWRIADHTTGNEMGRMMVINGYYAGYVIGQTTVAVEPNTDYLTSYWVLNLCRQPTGYVNPEFSVKILDMSGGTIYSHNFTDEIGVNPDCPEWIQIGTIFNTHTNTQITVQFISEGGPETGNDFVIDDVSLNRVETLTLNVQKDACPIAWPGGRVRFAITIDNPTLWTATQVNIIDDLSYLNTPEYSIDAGDTWHEWTGSLAIDDIPPETEVGILLLRGVVPRGTSGVITNQANVEVTFCEQIN